MDTFSDTLEQATVLLEQLARVPVEALTDEEVCLLTVQAERAGRFMDAIRVRTAAEIDERSRFELGTAGLSYRLGQRRSDDFIEQLTLVSAATANQRIRLGVAIRPRLSLTGEVLPAAHPHVAAALMSGDLGVDAAAGIVRMLDQATTHSPYPEQFDESERYLVSIGALKSADLVAVEARVQREALDPDGAPEREAQLRARRRFRFGRESHGLATFSGACDPASAALLRSAFTESNAPDAKPRFLSDEDLQDAASDPRTREQRQLDVLIGLVTAGLRSTGQRPTATVMAVVTFDDLENHKGVAWLDDADEPISAASLQQMVCDSGFQRVLVGRNGQIVGRSPLERYFSTVQRKQLAVRDGGCVWPGCTAPPSWCEAHHVLEWEHGGATVLDNGVLLCPAHHHMLHSSAFTMKMVDGRPMLLAPPWIDPDQTWRMLGRQRVMMQRVTVPEPAQQRELVTT
jgi:hypothetical protein